MLVLENALTDPQIETVGNAISYDYSEHKVEAKGNARSFHYDYDMHWSEWIQHFNQRIKEINEENQEHEELHAGKHVINEGLLLGFEIFSKITPSRPAIFSNGDGSLQLSTQSPDKARKFIVEIDPKASRYKLIVVGHPEWKKPKEFSMERGKTEARKLLNWLNSK